MAIYHFSGTIISRSQGRSAVACASYRSAEKLYDERYEKTHDYTRKQEVAFSEILTPPNAPDWMRDREKLWNEVEAAEKRKDAQLARDFNFALPRELTPLQNTTLAREFVQTHFVDKGMVADLCIHDDVSPEGERQPHAHVMLTMREVTSTGFGPKVREWNAKENVLLWREAWAEVANRHLALHGHDLQIDHRSLKEQGIALEPQYKIGASVARDRMARLEDHQRIARANGEKIFNDPMIALNAMTRQQSTFTHQDMARFVNRHTVDAEQFKTVFERVKGCEQLVALGLDDKQRERFTTQEMLAIESQMIKHTASLSEREAHPVSKEVSTHALTTKQLTEEQQVAFTHLTEARGLSCVVGYAGTGKSYLLGATREAWEAQGYQVLGATLSGIAAENLEASSGIESRTLASRFYYWDKGEQLLTSKDVLVIDEAGMIGSRQMARVLHEAETRGAKVVLIGDPEQLQAIEAGAAFRAISERTGLVELTDIRRQQDTWQKEATREFATGKTQSALERYEQHGHVHAFETPAAAKEGMVSLWNDVRVSQPDKTQIMLTYTRADVCDLNEMARSLRQVNGELGKEASFMTERGERNLAENDRIYFLKNERSLGVMNGTLGTIESIQDKTLTVRLDQDERQPGKTQSVTFTIDQYNQIDHGYAATIHKGQGVTVDRSYVLASQHMDRHSTYVAGTRHREGVEFCYSKETFTNIQELSAVLSRERAKDVTLDYTQTSFAEKRGIGRIEKLEKNALSFDQPTHTTQQLCKSHEPLELRQEHSLRQAALAYDRLQTQQKTPAREGFSAFKAEFEAKHPEQARALQDAVRPRHERLALEAEKQFSVLEKLIEKSHMPRSAKEQLEKYAAGISKQPEVMAYLKEHNKALSEKIQGLAKARELELERGGRSL